MAELEAAIVALEDDDIERSISGETTRVLHWLASSNYRTSFPASIDISERVLFPSGPTESHGMEDAGSSVSSPTTERSGTTRRTPRSTATRSFRS